MNFSPNQPEWRMLILGDIDPGFNSFALKLLLEKVKSNYTSKLLSLESAVDQLCQECDKNKELFRSDLEVIFEFEKSDLKKQG